MKRHFILMAAALMIIACSKDRAGLGNISDLNNLNQQQNEEVCEVSLDFGPETKALSTEATNEDAITSLQVFVFRNGNIDGFGSFTSTGTVSVKCTAGMRKFVVLANCKDYSSITSESVLMAKISDFNENKLGGFVMTGIVSAEVHDKSIVAVQLDRLASRIVLKKVSVNWGIESLKNLKFEVKKVYLTNVVKSVNFQATSPTGWYNKDNDNTSTELSDKPQVVKLIKDDIIDGGVTEAVAYTKQHNLYAYPNGTNTKTRIVLETTLGDATYYYGISLPKLERNTSYEINEIKITKPGSDSGDTDITGAEATVQISVNPWTTVNITDGTII